MEQKLFTELRPLYTTSKESPNEIRIRIRMCDLIDSDVLRHAVDSTMERYPYFRVELQKKGEQYIFAENHRPVVITNSLHGVDLNTEDSNFHMIACLTVEISAVNGRFTLDFLQTFSSPVFVNAFLKELEDNGIVYDLQDVNKLELPNIKLPWTE